MKEETKFSIFAVLFLLVWWVLLPKLIRWLWALIQS